MLSTAMRYFLEVSGSGSIRLAAERLHISPSAISRQVALLEHELGGALLTRTRRGITLTEQGELLAAHARSAAREEEKLRAAIDDLGNLRSGHVNVAAVEAAVARVLPRCLAMFHKKYPAISVAVRIAGTHQVAEAVVRNDADIGIALAPSYEDELLLRMRWPQPLHVVAHPSHPIASLQIASLQDAVTYPYSLPDRSFGIRVLIERGISKAGLKCKPMVEASSLEILKNLAIGGHTLTILPPEIFIREAEAGMVHAIPLADNPLKRATIDIVTARSQRLSRASTAFLDCLKQEISDLEGKPQGCSGLWLV